MSSSSVCKEIRRQILHIAHYSKHGHIPTCFSIVEILHAVYGIMNHRPAEPDWGERDLFVLSKGHGALAHYSILAHCGYFSSEELKTLGSHGSRLGCHASRLKIPGVEVSTGSLGHGIGVAVGMALALKIKNSKRRVFTVIGDGEANEGSVWESVMNASHLQLDNLTVIYDNNMSHSRGLQIMNPAQRLAAFGCETEEVNGHDVAALKTAMDRRDNKNVKAVVAHTKKGYGCKTLVANHYEWHGRIPDQTVLEMLLEELDEETI